MGLHSLVSELRMRMRRGRINPLLVRGRGRRLVLHTSFRDRAKVIRTRAWMGHLVKQADDMLFLPTAWACETRFPSETGILGFRGSVLPITSGTGSDIVYSSTPQCGSWACETGLPSETGVRVRGTSISPKVLHMRLLLHRQAR